MTALCLESAAPSYYEPTREPATILREPDTRSFRNRRLNANCEVHGAFMHFIGHTCHACQALTIFAADATFPRRCARCDRIVRVSRKPIAKCDSRIHAMLPDVPMQHPLPVKVS